MGVVSIQICRNGAVFSSGVGSLKIICVLPDKLKDNFSAADDISELKRKQGNSTSKKLTLRINQ